MATQPVPCVPKRFVSLFWLSFLRRGLLVVTANEVVLNAAGLSCGSNAWRLP